MVDIINPIETGRKLFRTSSMTETFANPATAMSDDQAINVPPPTHIEPICPIADNVSTSTPTLPPKAPDNEPTKGRPENPEPYNPVITPIKRIPNPAIKAFSGKKC